MKDLISIIIPVYNTENYIGKLLKCLKNQTYKNLEIIIVNDASTDNSLNIIQSFAKEDSRIKVITIEKSGVSIARNVGIENANGDYITFLDSDDYINLDMYEKLLEKIKKEKTDIVRCNLVKENTSGDVISYEDMFDIANRTLSQEEIRNILIPYLFENKIGAYTYLLLIKKDVIKNIRFNPNIHMMEDLLFCLELFLSVNNIYFYDYRCYHYVINLTSGSKARWNILRNFNDTLKVVSLVENILKINNIDENILKKVYYIYSTMIVKYTLRTFQKDDEYKLSLEKLIELLDKEEVYRIIKDVEFLNDSEYIKTAGSLIKSKKYKELYEYAESKNDILI